MAKLHLEDGVEKMHIIKYFVIIKPPVTQMLHKYYFIVFWPFWCPHLLYTCNSAVCCKLKKNRPTSVSVDWTARWCKIYGNETHVLNKVWLAGRKRYEERETILDTTEAGWTLDSNP